MQSPLHPFIHSFNDQKPKCYDHSIRMADDMNNETIKKQSKKREGKSFRNITAEESEKEKEKPVANISFKIAIFSPFIHSFI